LYTFIGISLLNRSLWHRRSVPAYLEFLRGWLGGWANENVAFGADLYLGSVVSRFTYINRQVIEQRIKNNNLITLYGITALGIGTGRKVCVVRTVFM
jgi:hypothetical protein